jgi:hypothetical protein
MRWDQPMSPYHFFLFRNGEVVGQTDCQCADDPAALEIGRALSVYQTVEIYSKNRMVSRVEQTEASPHMGSRKLA